MGNLFTSLLNSTAALQVYGRALSVIQNNVANVNTPGYAKQDQVILSLPFDPARGISGGILAGPLYSYRSPYLELAVRNQQESLGFADQRTNDLSQIESQFDLSARFGIPAALNSFFNGFSELAVNPNNTLARQGILDRADAVAESFHQATAGLQQATVSVDGQTRAAVETVNRISQQIASINRLYRGSAQTTQDAGLDAQLHKALEELSEVVNFTLIRTPDGAANVYLGGQTILVLGDKARGISADISAGDTKIRDWAGQDVTNQATGGRLGALIEERNVTLTGYQADLDTLAAGLADTINTALAAGVDRNGLPPATDLFTYNAGTGAAATLSVNSLTPDDIAAALPSAPGGNGNTIALARLGTQPAIGGFTFTEYFGAIGARVGRDLNQARQERTQFQEAVTLARKQRGEQSGVSLDEEAAHLIQYQQAYQAAGKLVSVLNDLTDSVLNMIR